MSLHQSTVAALCGLSLLGVSMVSQAGYAVPMTAPKPAPVANWYLNGFGGVAVTHDLNDGDGDVVDHKVGYDAGGAIGYRTGPFRFEGQYTFIRNSWNDLSDTTSGLSLKDQGVDFSAKTTVHAVLANMYYDFQLPSDVLGLYVGGGVGWSHLTATVSATITDPSGTVTLMGSGSENKFAYQGAAGITFNVDNQFHLDLGYRYLATTRLNKVINDRYQTHLINLGITYHVPA